MKILIGTILVMTFSLSGCSSQKKLVENPPFEMGQATCQSWKGGTAQSGSGIKLEASMKYDNSEDIAVKAVFFRGNTMQCKVERTDSGFIVEANYNKTTKPDIVMHGDSKEEVGNQPPKLTDKEMADFKLDNDEAILIYTVGSSNKSNYYKIEGVKEKKPLIYR